MENKDVFAGVLCIAAGIFTILASIFDWDFFFENRKARIFMSILGRKGSRVFYVILGFVLFYLSYKIFTK